jgi:hypothetical protein
MWSVASALYADAAVFHRLFPPVPCDGRYRQGRSPEMSLYLGAVGSSDEIHRIQRRLNGFNWKKSQAWRHLSFQFGPTLTQEELVSIAELIAHRTGIRLDRDARRRKMVMLKWFEEHWTVIQPLLGLVVLDSD